MRSFLTAWVSCSDDLCKWLVATGLARQPDDVDDITQETALRALQAWSAKRDSSPAPWFKAIAAHSAADLYRYRSTKPLAGVDAGTCEQLPAPPSDSDDAVRTAALLDRMADAVELLSPREREVFRLRYEQGLSPRRIAPLMGKKTGTVRVTLHRIRERLRHALGTGPGEESMNPEIR